MRVPEALSASTSRGSQHAVPPKVSLCLILSGGITSSPLADASGMSVLDLHVSPSRTVLEAWADLVRGAWDQSDCPDIVVLHAGSGAVPSPAVDLNVRVRHDESEFRGPAGAIRDAAVDVEPDSYVLVVEGASFLRQPIGRLFCDPKESVSAVVGVNSDCSPAGLYLLRRDLLDLVPAIGFMDLKEQMLSQAKDAGHRIVVRDMGDRALQRLRTREDLLAASVTNDGLNGGPDLSYPIIARGNTIGNCRCNDSHIANDALLVDSVAMPGSTVGAKAVVVRSILFGGAHVEPGEIILDELVSSNGRSRLAASKHNGVNSR